MTNEERRERIAQREAERAYERACQEEAASK